MDRKYRHHISELDSFIMKVGRSGSGDNADEVGRAVALGIAELAQTITDLATDLYALELRVKSLEYKNQ